MFYHCVHFWLVEGLAEDQRRDFVQALHGLGECETVRSCRVARPAGTPRDVVDNSYDYQLLLSFDDVTGQDVYQDSDPRHHKFIEDFKTFWTRVLIYDSVPVED
ncbi:MAG: Dabb family protein [Phycisphaerae bacterium]|nr:Dabb family protein [Phycisphaerae bacterium]